MATEIREYYIPDFSEWKNHDLYVREFEKCCAICGRMGRLPWRELPDGFWAGAGRVGILRPRMRIRKANPHASLRMTAR